MVLPVATSNGPGVRFHVLGIPVRFDVWFFIIGTVFTLQYGVPVVVLWLTVLGGSVLVHELGHALVARTTGAEPQIVIHGLGGLTSWQPAGAVSRSRRIAISLAGPAAGIALGLVFVAVRRAGVGTSGDSLLLQRAMFYGIRINILYGLINLLPILPLDGGQTLRELLPGSPARREVRAATVSVVFAAVAAVLAYRAGLVFGALMAAFFLFSNVMTIRHARDLDKVDVNERVMRLLWMDRAGDAQHLAGEPGLHPLTTSALRAVGPDPVGGRRELETAARTNAAEATAATGLLLAVHRVNGDWAAARDVVAGEPRVHAGNVLFAQTLAFQSGAKRESAEIGQAWLDRTGPVLIDHVEVPALIAYNTACGWAAAGELDRGIAAFRRAAELGFADLTAVDSDDDIAPLRPLPGYDEARQVIRQRALARVEEAPST
jgi:Zn-dependent protease